QRGEELYVFEFCFSSRRRHTIFSRDWSSDVCSSDLDLSELERDENVARWIELNAVKVSQVATPSTSQPSFKGVHAAERDLGIKRSEERRVGTECGSRWSAQQENRNI